MTDIEVDLHLPIGTHPAATPRGPHVLDGAVGQGVAVETLVAEWTRALTLVEILALFLAKSTNFNKTE